MKISTASELGLRDYQEDRYVVHHTNAGVLLGIMDGHGGEDVADVCRDYLATFWDLSILNRHPQEALGLVVWQLDCITNEYHCGSTVSLAFVPTAEDFVHVATLGDSPVIVRSPDGIAHVSTSHNVRTNLEEREAAIKRGAEYRNGYIFDAQQWRNGDGLQMGRALGDSSLSTILSRKPSIETHVLGDFILLGSDGILDPSHENELQAAAAVIALIDNGGDAQDIVDRAVKLPSEDNATAILFTKEPRSNVLT
jgi:serine/threonine protein phosphatase PrpC